MTDLILASGNANLSRQLPSGRRPEIWIIAMNSPRRSVISR
jgi:hypothetical protein